MGGFKKSFEEHDQIHEKALRTPNSTLLGKKRNMHIKLLATKGNKKRDKLVDNLGNKKEDKTLGKADTPSRRTA